MRVSQYLPVVYHGSLVTEVQSTDIFGISLILPMSFQSLLNIIEGLISG